MVSFFYYKKMNLKKFQLQSNNLKKDLELILQKNITNDLTIFVPESISFIAESGIKTRADIVDLEKGKVNGVLIGETFMRSKNKKEMLDELKGN